ncbi:MAG TPA: radical SAM protein [Candidatus Sulfomarinibacteraceae bacterium]|nr:radical SAM protein [Candidatus Sulfomarinibacteraceae bacterium]
MRVVLYNPPSSAGRKPVLPMSLLALDAVLDEGRGVVIVDGNLEPDPLAALDGLVAGRARDTVLGVTVMPGPQLAGAAPLCRELKRRHPALTVVWGGAFPSQHWDACLRSDAVDYVVRGHGEHAFAELLGSLKSGSPGLDAIAGLAWRDGSEPRTGAPAVVPHPDELPEWRYQRVDMARYLRPTFLGRATVAAHTSYGCPFSCNFCSVVTMTGGRWLAQSAQRVARTFTDYRRRWGVDAVELADNNFFVDEGRAAEVAERVAPLGMAWWGEGRVDTMLGFADATWRALGDSGLRMVFMGAESGSAETLARMDKGGRLAPEHTLELVRVMGARGIVPELSFVLGNPPDPEEDAARTFELIRRVKAANPATEIILYLYTPVPLAGELLDGAEAAGFAFPDTLDEWLRRDWLDFAERRGRRMSWLEPDLSDRIRDFERVVNAYYPTTTMASLTAPKRALLRALSAWRWHGRFYRWPLELAALQRLVAYRRPETSGF